MELYVNFNWDKSWEELWSNIVWLHKLGLLEEFSELDAYEYYNYDYKTFLEFINDRLLTQYMKDWNWGDYQLEIVLEQIGKIKVR